MTEREEQLLKEGWQRRFAAAEPRLSEAVKMYKEAGFEVHLEPLKAVEEPPERGCQGCRICFQGVEDRYRVIFTRRKRNEDHRGDPFHPSR